MNDPNDVLKMITLSTPALQMINDILKYDAPIMVSERSDEERLAEGLKLIGVFHYYEGGYILSVFGRNWVNNYCLMSLSKTQISVVKSCIVGHYFSNWLNNPQEAEAIEALALLGILTHSHDGALGQPVYELSPIGRLLVEAQRGLYTSPSKVGGLVWECISKSTEMKPSFIANYGLFKFYVIPRGDRKFALQISLKDPSATEFKRVGLFADPNEYLSIQDAQRDALPLLSGWLHDQQPV